ncbi:MAG: hypothetical protein PWP71_2728 [Clostridia bacterium]|nr:hypothetical protein [Clostridia bacterium]
MEVQLTSLHWIYVVMVLIVLITMIFRRDTVLPCFIGLLVIGFAAKGSIIGALQVVYNALIAAGNEFWGIIAIISLVVAMSKALADVGADYLVMQPAARAMVNPSIAFWVLGIAMLLVSWFVWPSPAVALIGAIVLPVAVRAGLPVMGAAISMNIFGHGIGLSSDYFIQGAPAITAKSAGFADASGVIGPSIPLWLTCSIIASVTAFIMLKRDISKNQESIKTEQRQMAKEQEAKASQKFTWVSYFIAILIPVAFGLDVLFLYLYQIRGGDATALIGGTAAVIMCIAALLQFGFDSLEKITDYIRDGFMFGIKIFAPVVVIGGFFFLGSEGTAKVILGEQATGLLTDLGYALAASVPLGRVPVAFIQLIIGAITGLDGSGFSGLPLVGSLSQTFGSAIAVDKGTLGALGQLASVWVGGGTVVPWGLIPVAAICGVDPMELARRNFIPVVLGLLGATVMAIFLM